MNSTKSPKNLITKFAVITLALIIIAGSVPVFAGGFTPKTQEATANPEAYNLFPVYQWHRVDTQKDLPATGLKVPVIFCWRDGGNTYYSTGGYTGKYNDYDGITGKVFPKDARFYPDPFDNSADNDSFFTTAPIGDWTMQMTGSKDKSNENALKMRFWMNGSLISGYDDWDWEGERDSCDHDQWSIYTHELGGDYGDELESKRVRVYHEVSGCDVGFVYRGEHMYGYESNTYYYSKLVMYWGEVLYVSAITEDYVIGDGMVMNIDDGVILNDGVTLKVMPGGVLSIEGQFYNNGTIENHGTVIVQPNSCITSFNPKKNTAGSIINTGAEIDTKADAQKNRDAKQTKISTLESENKDLEGTIAKAIADYKDGENDKLKTLTGTEEGKEALKVTLERKAAEIEVALAYIEEARAKGVPEESLDQYKAQTVTPLVDEYNKLNEPVAALEEIIAKAHETEKNSKAKIEENNELIKKLKGQISELDVLIGSNTNVKRRGEGDLIVMDNARIGLEDKAQLSIMAGGSCNCNGLILSPAPVILSDSKLIIRKSGALIVEYHLTKNILNLKDLKITGKGSKEVSLDGLEFTGVDNKFSVLESGNFKFIVDGAFRYHQSPVGLVEFNITRTTAVTDGQGSWTYHNSPISDIDKDGTIYVKKDNGDYTAQKKDGSEIYYEAKTGVTTELNVDGSKTITQKDGTKKTTYPNGDYKEWYPSGQIKDEVMHYEAYTEYFDDLENCYTRYYKSDQTDDYGVYSYEKVFPYDDNEYERYYEINGDKVYIHYNRFGEWMYEYRSWIEKEWSTTSYRWLNIQVKEYTYKDVIKHYRNGRLEWTKPRTN
ncbi:MAG: hypothetical protein MJ186_04310 [Clostridia bacterium]|nr:hypothetical protein [Clostridia bacterium]